MKRKIKKWVAEIIGLFIVLLGVTLLSFSLMYIAPGDPARTILQSGGTMPSEEAIQEKALSDNLTTTTPPAKYQ